MTAEEIKKKDSEYIMHTYGRFDIVLDHGKGATLWDAEKSMWTSRPGSASTAWDMEMRRSSVRSQNRRKSSCMRQISTTRSRW